MVDRVVLEGGKYTLEFGTDEHGTWVFRALRYNEPWMDSLSCVQGSGMLLAMAYELLAYREFGCVGVCRMCHAPLVESGKSVTSSTQRVVGRIDRGNGLRVAPDSQGFLWCQECVDKFESQPPPGEE